MCNRHYQFGHQLPIIIWWKISAQILYCASQIIRNCGIGLFSQYLTTKLWCSSAVLGFMFLLFIVVSLLLVKAVLLHTTCLSSTFLLAKRRLSTKPFLQWTSSWTKSNAHCIELATLWSLKMWYHQVESKHLTAKLLWWLLFSTHPSGFQLIVEAGKFCPVVDFFYFALNIHI